MSVSLTGQEKSDLNDLSRQIKIERTPPYDPEVDLVFRLYNILGRNQIKHGTPVTGQRIALYTGFTDSVRIDLSGPNSFDLKSMNNAIADITGLITFEGKLISCKYTTLGGKQGIIDLTGNSQPYIELDKVADIVGGKVVIKLYITELCSNDLKRQRQKYEAKHKVKGELPSLESLLKKLSGLSLRDVVDRLTQEEEMADARISVNIDFKRLAYNLGARIRNRVLEKERFQLFKPSIDNLVPGNILVVKRYGDSHHKTYRFMEFGMVDGKEDRGTLILKYISDSKDAKGLEPTAFAFTDIKEVVERMYKNVNELSEVEKEAEETLIAAGKYLVQSLSERV